MKPTDAEFARNQDYIVQLTEKREEVVKSINETELQISSLSSSILAIGKEIDNMTKSKDKRNRRTR